MFYIVVCGLCATEVGTIAVDCILIPYIHTQTGQMAGTGNPVRVRFYVFM
jgi:hypothetical protein